MVKKLLSKFRKNIDAPVKEDDNTIDTIKLLNPDGTLLATITVEIPAENCKGENTAKAWTKGLALMLRERSAQRSREIELQNRYILDEWFEKVYGNQIPVQ